MEKHISQLLMDIVQPAERTQALVEANKKRYCPEYARFKLQFIDRMGNTSIPYWSFDIQKSVGGIYKTNEEIGWLKLIKYVGVRVKKDDFVTASIWVNLTDDLQCLVNGRLNKKYDHLVFKYTRNQSHAFIHKAMRFIDGGPPYPHSQLGKIVDVDTLFRAIASEKKGAQQ